MSSVWATNAKSETPTANTSPNPRCFGRKRAPRPENLLKIARALNVSVDYLLTGDIIDKDLLLLSEKLNKLTPTQFRTVENIVNECISLNEKAE